MMNVEEILKRMNNGEKAEDIASEFTNALNGAIKEFDAKQKAESTKLKKINDMEQILSLIYDFILEHYVDTDEEVEMVDNAFSELTGETVVDAIEEACAQFTQLQKFMDGFNISIHTTTASDKEPHVCKCNNNPAADAVDSKITSFLSKMGW